MRSPATHAKLPFVRARVLIIGAAGAVEQLTYAVPEQLNGAVLPGHRVLVSLRSRRVTGVVSEVGDELDTGGVAPKPLLEILDPRPLFDRAHLRLLEFLARYYMAPLADAFRSIMPALARVESRRTFHLANYPDALACAAMIPLERSVLDSIKAHPRTLRQLSSLGPQHELKAAVAHLTANGWVLAQQASRGRHRLSTAPIVRLKAGAVLSELRSSRQQMVLQRIRCEPSGVPLTELEAQTSGARHAVRELRRRGLVEIVADGFRSAAAPESPLLSERMPGAAAPLFDLNPEQAAAVDAVAPVIRQRRFEAFLLWGVTASGKTEVYLRLAAETLAVNRQVLVLVPEIALADQVVESFGGRFGSLVALAHSAQKVAERWATWMAALGGNARVIIGPRSVIFAPLHDIGLIVVDEEHDPAYKQEEGIRYNARDLAVALGRFAECPVILGSATPAAESYANARRGRYRMLRLTRRVADRELARVEIVDLRRYPPARDKESPAADNRAMPAEIPLAQPLVEALQTNLDDGAQSLVFLNRRGYHNFLQCHLCGTAISCTNCSVPMTFHLQGRALRCHYCGANEPAPAQCFECGGFGLQGQGFGTERLVEALTQKLPSARIARMDSDTSGRGGARSAILQQLRRGSLDLLVGTQMITKGLDLPGVTLVAVVLADLTLNMPDFRSAERTFQLLTQVAGRAGRGERPGRVLIQTYAPFHYSVRAAAEQDYSRFIRRELELRRELMYPPFARVALVRIEGEDAAEVGELAARAAASLARAAPKTMRVLGPAPAPIERIKRRYRWQVMAKSPELNELRAALASMRAEITPPANRLGIRVATDIDPINML